jgi:cbb3-type cytochrome oxidase cytochrome c subunit
MKKRFTPKNIAIVLVFLFLLIQSIRFEKTTEPFDAKKDFVALSSPGTEVANTLKAACYDCHSGQPVYPWYSNIAPISWWMQNHIDEGTRHLNFSIWGTYSDKKKDHKLEECIEMVEEGEMPMASYTWMHKDAKLSDKQKENLVDFFRAQRSLIALPDAN